MSVGAKPCLASYDLLYVGGGQDREQAMITPDLSARGDAIREAVEDGVALLAVCGGYQLLGRGYRGRDGSWLEGVGLFPHETVAGDTRMIGDVLLESTLAEAAGQDDRRLREPRGAHAPRRGRRAARPRRRRVRERRHLGLRGLPGRARSRDVPPRAAPAAQPLARRPAPLLGPRARDGRRARAARAARRRARAPRRTPSPPAAPVRAAAVPPEPHSAQRAPR